MRSGGLTPLRETLDFASFGIALFSGFIAPSWQMDPSMKYQVSLLPISWPRSDTPALSDLTPAIHLLPSLQNMGPSPPLSLSQ